MEKLTRAGLLSLEAYALARPEIRARVIAHKRQRRVALGQHATLLFEDRLTVQYQVQEMLRAERIFEPAGIRDELDAYNPLVPDGTNWKATLLIEFPDERERRVALAQLRGVEDRCYVAIAAERTYAIADEDLDRENAQKTSAVHFLRFELPATAREALAAGAPLRFGIDHPAYSHEVTASPDVRAALLADL